MPVITMPPPVPSYLPLLTESGWVVTLAMGAAVLGVVLTIALSRQVRRRRSG